MTSCQFIASGKRRSMVEIAMRRQGARLVPVDEISADDLVRVPANRDVLVKITSHLNMKLFRLLWVLASKGR